MMLFVKDARGLWKRTNELVSMLSSRHCYLKLSLIIWSTHFLWALFRASTVLLVQCIYNFNQKLKFTEVYVSFQKFFFFVFFFVFCCCFFFIWVTVGGADYKNKNGKCRVKKSKTMLILGANTVVTLKSLLEMEE